MLSCDFYNPVRIISGQNCVSDYKDYRAFGLKALIVCGKTSAKLCGALDDMEKALSSQGVDYRIFDRCEQNPLIETCREGGEAAAAFNADFIIAIGGGSPIDAAKAVCVFAANCKLDNTQFFSAESWENDPLPLIAVNTTAGTGSEVTPFSVLTVKSFGNKKSVASPKLFPKIAFLDPKYTYILPRDITINTAIDALSHAVEGLFYREPSIITDSLSRRAIKLLGEGLHDTKSGNLNKETREKLLYGSTLAGLVISRTATGFTHPMGYPLTYFHGVPHGMANAYFMPEYLKFQAVADPARADSVLALLKLDGIEEYQDFIFSFFDFNVLPEDDELASYVPLVRGAKNLTQSVRELSEDRIFEILKHSVDAVKAYSGQ